MRPAMNEGRDRHLTQDERELFLPVEGTEEPSADLRQHVEDCERCHREVEALRSLHAALASLPRLDPRPGFADAVMARVRLPAPWYVRVWKTARSHWLPLSVATAMVAATIGIGVWWLASQPELTLGGLIGFTLDRLVALFWASVVATGRLVWESGLPNLLRTVGSRVGVTGALAGMAAIVVASLLTTFAMFRLLAPQGGAARTTRS